MRYWIGKLPWSMRCRSSRHARLVHGILLKDAGKTEANKDRVEVVCFYEKGKWRPIPSWTPFLRWELESEIREATKEEAAMIMFEAMS